MRVVVILAGGLGKRAGLPHPKQFLMRQEKPVICRFLEIYKGLVDKIIFVIHPDWIEFSKKHLEDTIILEGGNTRHQSSYNAMNFLSHKLIDMVLIQDASRPFVSRTIVRTVIEASKRHSIVVPGVKVQDTIFRVRRKFFKQFLDGEEIVLGQTPQAIKFSLWKQAHNTCKRIGIEYGDDASMVSDFVRCQIKIVEGSYSNKKITNPEDVNMLILGDTK